MVRSCPKLSSNELPLSNPGVPSLSNAALAARYGIFPYRSLFSYCQRLARLYNSAYPQAEQGIVFLQFYLFFSLTSLAEKPVSPLTKRPSTLTILSEHNTSKGDDKKYATEGLAIMNAISVAPLIRKCGMVRVREDQLLVGGKPHKSWWKMGGAMQPPFFGNNFVKRFLVLLPDALAYYHCEEKGALSVDQIIPLEFVAHVRYNDEDTTSQLDIFLFPSVAMLARKSAAKDDILLAVKSKKKGPKIQQQRVSLFLHDPNSISEERLLQVQLKLDNAKQADAWMELLLPYGTNTVVLEQPKNPENFQDIAKRNFFSRRATSKDRSIRLSRAASTFGTLANSSTQAFPVPSSQVLKSERWVAAWHTPKEHKREDGLLWLGGMQAFGIAPIDARPVSVVSDPTQGIDALRLEPADSSQSMDGHASSKSKGQTRMSRAGDTSQSCWSSELHATHAASHDFLEEDETYEEEKDSNLETSQSVSKYPAKRSTTADASEKSAATSYIESDSRVSNSNVQEGEMVVLEEKED